MARSLFISANDISGDQHASRLVSRLKESMPDLEVWGVGGPALKKVGARLLFNAEDLSVVGIMRTVHMLPLLAEARDTVSEEIAKNKPDAVLLVDSGGLNLAIAKKIRAAGLTVPIIYFISPQVWGSRPWRINTIARTVDQMLVIFPFEENLYRGRGIDAHFIGHPLTDRYSDLTADPPREEFCARHGLDPCKPLVGIFPGSRRAEIKEFMPTLLQAITWLHSERPDIQFVISQASPQIAEQIIDSLDTAGKTTYSGSVIKFVNAEDNRGLMAASDLLWTKSGTTTLEAAFMEKPMLVYYRADWLSFVLFVLFKTVKYISWPNLLAGKMLVPELIQLDCRAEQLVRYTSDLLDVPGARANIARQLRNIKSYLQKGDFAANAAEHLQKVLEKAPVSELKVAE